MEKKLKDLKEGDIVWIIGYGDYSIKPFTISKYPPPYFTSKEFIYIPGYRRFPIFINGNRKSFGCLFACREDAIETLTRHIRKKKILLEKRIEVLVSEFEKLDSITPPTVFSYSTKLPSMKELKPGNVVWYVDKAELRIKGVKVKTVKKDLEPWSYGSLVFTTDSISFRAHPNSTRSVSLKFYTTEEQAWKYMLEWKKSRLKTVGNEMERKIRNFEDLEKYEEIWRPTERG